MLLRNKQISKYVGVLVLVLGVLFFGASVVGQCSSVSQVSAIDIAHPTHGYDLSPLSGTLQHNSHIVGACFGFVFLILMVGRKYYLAADKRNWSQARISHFLFKPNLPRPPSLVFALSLSQLGVSRT